MSSIQQRIGIESLDFVTLVVDDQEAALAFYTETLGFEKKMDESFDIGGETGRWLTIGLPGQGVQISLVTADAPHLDDENRARLEAKRGVETWWSFSTEDIESSVAAMEAAGVEITDGPETREWGTEAMFADPCGNRFSLIEYAVE